MRFPATHRPLAGRRSWPGGELEDLADDLEPGGDLPDEEQDVERVERDVQAPGRLVPLLHRRDQRRRARPQHRDGRSGEEVGPREELAGAEPGVERAADGLEHAEAEQDGPRVEVPIPERPLEQLLPLLIEMVWQLIEIPFLPQWFQCRN